MLRGFIWHCAEHRRAYIAARILIPLVVVGLAITIAILFARVPFFPWAIAQAAISIVLGAAGTWLFRTVGHARRSWLRLTFADTKIYLHGIVHRDVQ